MSENTDGIACFKKRTDRYFHLTTWRPDTIPVGVPVSTPRDDSNYWTCHHDVEAMTQLCLQQLESGQSIGLPLAAAKTFAASKARDESEKEHLLEKIRSVEFPGLPSRRRCMFLCESESQLNEYIRTHKFPLEGRVVIELETVYFGEPLSKESWGRRGLSEADFRELNECRRHRANPRFLDCNSLSSEAQMPLLRRYWRGEGTEPDELTEVLFEGFFRVVRVLE